MVGHNPIEVAKTVVEVADVAWTAMERFDRHHHHHDEAAADRNNSPPSENELEALRSENQRLRNLLEKNLNLLQNLSEAPCLSRDCPSDLYARLVATVDSENFLTQLKSLSLESADGTGCKFPFKDVSGADLQSSEILINVDLEEPSWWVWVTDEMVPSNVEERSGIDNESYVIVTEEQVVDGVANFMARCILSNPKAQGLKPEELQNVLTNALGGMNKLDKMLHVWHAGMMFYTLSTWGLALVGLYKSRAVLRLAAKGIHTTGKVVMRAL